MISLCMIVRNEENALSRCLNNIKGKVDEIIIVDTGSNDKTKEIAKKYTNEIFDFKWCDDFAAARNFSISKAKHDWILVLDADEEVTEFNNEAINEFTNTDKKIVGRIKIINPFEDSSGKKILFGRVKRFFNRKYFKYEGIIHEQIVKIDGEDYNTVNVDITVNHIGYEKQVISRTNKTKRNKELLKKAIKQKNDDSYLYYQLGKTFFIENDYLDAELNFEKAIEFERNMNYEYVQDLIESYGYTLINLKKYKKALELINYESAYKDIADFNFVMGLIYMNNAMFKEAVLKFIECQNSDECNIEGVNSYLANYNIGVIYECLGFTEEAVKFYKKCGDYKLALNRLNIIR